MPPKKVLKETTSTSKDFDNTHTTDIGTSSSSVEQSNETYIDHIRSCHKSRT